MLIISRFPRISRLAGVPMGSSLEVSLITSNIQVILFGFNFAMPRPPIKHVTNAGTETVVLDSIERESIIQSLADRGLDQGQSVRYADAVNRSAVFAYELEPKMSTRGQSKRWHHEVLKAVDRNELAKIRKLLSNSADAFEGRSELECQLLQNSGGLAPALDTLRAYCEAKIAVSDGRNKRTPRRSTCRQMLADDLVREWRVLFDHYPPYREGSDSTFLDVLKHTIHLSEAIYRRDRPRALVTGEALRSFTKRACAKDRRQVAQESQTPK